MVKFAILSIGRKGVRTKFFQRQEEEAFALQMCDEDFWWMHNKPVQLILRALGIFVNSLRMLRFFLQLDCLPKVHQKCSIMQICH